MYIYINHILDYPSSDDLSHCIELYPYQMVICFPMNLYENIPSMLNLFQRSMNTSWGLAQIYRLFRGSYPEKVPMMGELCGRSYGYRLSIFPIFPYEKWGASWSY